MPYAAYGIDNKRELYSRDWRVARGIMVPYVKPLLLAALFAQILATQVEFNRAGKIAAVLGEKLYLNCLSVSYHVTELLEIGEEYTLEQKGVYFPQDLPNDITFGYEPNGCGLIDDNTQCSKITNMTVTADMDGKAYQCRSFRVGEDHLQYYSEGGIIRVMETFINTLSVILSDPDDRTVFLDDSAFFSCITQDSFTSHWRLNETDYDDLPSQIQDDLVFSTISATLSVLLELSIPARAEYNGTRVQCVANHSVASDTATLRIQGLLSSVGDLTANSGISLIIILWSAPFSLDVTGVDPDIWYSVLIYNVTDNPTVIPCTDCINITETNYTFTPDYPSPCHKYIFTVIPLNGAGQGHSSGNISVLKTDDPAINITRTGIAAADTGCIITFEACGDVERICEYTLHGLSNMDEVVFLRNSSHLGNGVNISYTLLTNRKYSTYFEVTTAAGMINISYDTFTTFDMQELTAIVGDDGDSIVVTGELITNSRARGCFIVLQGNSSTADIFKVLQRNRQTVSGTISTPPATYTVYGYDIEETALPNSNAAVILSVETKNPTNPKTITSASSFLDRASISRNGSEVTADCAFAAGYPEASCVLVYREYRNSTLTVIELPIKSFQLFPVPLPVITPENYTFAIFGKNGVEMEEEPAFIVKFMKSSTVDQPQPSPDERLKKNNFPTETVAVSTAASVVVVIITCALVITIILVIKRRKLVATKGDRAPVPEANSVVYDYITLPPVTSVTSAGSITTEPNTAYATTLHQTLIQTLPLIYTNVAYSPSGT